MEQQAKQDSQGPAPAEPAAKPPSEWDQTVAELSRSAQDAVGMVAAAAGKAGETLGPALDTLGAVAEVAGVVVEAAALVAEIVDAVTPD